MPLFNPYVSADEPAQIDALPSKTTPVGADEILIEDSAEGYAKKKLLISNLPPDGTAIHKATAAEINAITAKGTPVGADILLIEDSAASFAKKKVLISNLPATVDTTAIHKATAGEIAAMTEKTVTANADLLVIEDSAAANAKKKVQLTNVLSGVGAVIRQTQQQDVTVDNTISTVPPNYIRLFSVTITTGTGGVLILFSACAECSSASGLLHFALTMDNTAPSPGVPTGVLVRGAVRVSAGSNPQPMALQHYEAVTAGSHTFDAWWATSAGDGKILATTKPAQEHGTFTVLELR